MTVEILLAPVGAGKTEVALERLVNVQREQPFAKIWVLVSGRRQEDAFRQRLVERSGEQCVYFNVEFLSFYQLYYRLLNIMRQPAYKLDDAARYGLLRSILDQHADQLQVYRAIARTPGFVRVVADFIYELKQDVIPHINFEKAATSPKDRDLALIYTTYQEKLIEKDVVDREGEGWLALYRMRADEYHWVGCDVDLLLVDGFDQFTPLQAQLLMLLANRAQRALITLTTVPGREQTVGRRFQQALERLLASNPDDQPKPILTKRLVPPRGVVDGRAPALRHLVDHIFHLGRGTAPAGDRVVFIEASDPVQETSAVLRRVKRLLLDENNLCQPDDILIALRDWPRYAGHITVFGRAYGLPLALHRGDPLASNPAVMLLLNLVRLHERDFRRRDLLDVLRSPYFDVPGLSREQVDVLDRISRRFFVSGGRAAWLDAIKQAAAPYVGKDDDEADKVPPLQPEQAQRLIESLTAFFDGVTPPEYATLDGYVEWLDGLIGWDGDDVEQPGGYSLNVPAQIRRDSAEGVVERDLAAVSELKRVLRGLRSSQALLSTLGEGGELARINFILELVTALGGAAVNQRPRRDGRVLVTTVTDARGLPHKHVFIPGLSEGVFPAPLAEDPLYLDSERVELTRRGIPLQTSVERASDDGLFYELISLAHESLTLSRPTVRDGAPWVASHLWREAAAVFSDFDQVVQRVRSGAVIADCAAVREAAVAVADALNGSSMTSPGLYNWLLSEMGAGWRRIQTARRVELERGLRRLPFDRYTGRLHHPLLIEHVRRELGPDCRWSASQLNDYGVCGFRFFAKRLLRLDTLEDPEEGLDSLKLGSINHKILEDTYAEIARRGLAFQPESADEALTILRQTAADVLPNAPQEYGFRETAQWAQEKVALVRRLEALIRLDFSDQSPIAQRYAPDSQLRQTYWLEAPFGTDGAVPVWIPVEIDGYTERLNVLGYIDRVDRIGDGVVVIDYKTGSTPIPVAEMQAGRNFQMMVYLWAANHLLEAVNDPDRPTQVLGGLFWHLRTQRSSGTVLLRSDDHRAVMEQAQHHIGRYIAAGRRGDFTVQANKPAGADGRCTHYCEYSRFCRAASTHRHKS